MLTRGKLHVELLGDNFPGETQEGAAMLVARVRAALNVRFQGPAASPMFCSRTAALASMRPGVGRSRRSTKRLWQSTLCQHTTAMMARSSRATYKRSSCTRPRCPGSATGSASRGSYALGKRARGTSSTDCARSCSTSTTTMTLRACAAVCRSAWMNSWPLQATACPTDSQPLGLRHGGASRRAQPMPAANARCRLATVTP